MRILVPIAPAEKTQVAVDAAIEFAKRESADIVFCSVLDAAEMIVDPSSSFVDANPVLAAERANAERTLGAAEAKAAAHGVAADFRIAVGPAPAMIQRTAREVSADTIVMSTHARSIMGAAVLGSVTDAVLRAATIPVLVVPPQYRAALV